MGNGILPVEIVHMKWHFTSGNCPWEMAFYEWKLSTGNGILPVKIFHGKAWVLLRISHGNYHENGPGIL